MERKVSVDPGNGFANNTNAVTWASEGKQETLRATHCANEIFATHWELNPGPSACEADTSHTNHAECDNMQTRLRHTQTRTKNRAHPDLNQGPADLRSAALTTELCTRWAQVIGQ